MDNKNFIYGTPLAEQQDRIFHKIQNNLIPGDESVKLSSELARNRWVPAAEKLAPNNLALRQYCLIDILAGGVRHHQNIIYLINTIGVFEKKDQRLAGLWLEGYSYWQYVKPFILRYASRKECLVVVKTNRILSNYLFERIDAIDRGFQKTAYLRENVLYPTPFGSLRDVPLEQRLQDTDKIIQEIEIGPVKKVNNWYSVKKALLGFNSHIPDKDSSVIIADGRPVGFEFYTGFDDKYRNKMHEMMDMLKPTKIKSAFRILFKRA